MRMLISDNAIIGRSFHVTAPAKLNLRLKLEGRREDGYHLLSMLNSTLDLADELTITLVEPLDIKLSLEHEGAPDAPAPCPAEENLAYRAAGLFLERFDLRLGVKIHILKRIPAGAGLAGGSSDGAAVLRWLASTTRPWLALSDEDLEMELANLALKLGADVPFFLCGGFAHVSGVGERVRSLGSLSDLDLAAALILPAIQISTPSIFSICRSQRPVLPMTIDKEAQELSEHWEGLDLQTRQSGLLSLIENDLEPFVSALHPEIAWILRECRKYPGINACLTGSGAAIFCLARRTSTQPRLCFPPGLMESFRGVPAAIRQPVCFTKPFSVH
jgi:4-diphosphocytidyl-2-C-methyl-D-erythritol kinase